MKKLICIITLLILLIPSISTAQFCGFLRANTKANIRIGPFLDNTDGVTLSSSLTLSRTDVRISKNGGPLNTKAWTPALIYDSYGFYWFALAPADVDTPGRLMILINKTGSLMVIQTYQVVDETIYDTYFKDLP